MGRGGGNHPRHGLWFPRRSGGLGIASFWAEARGDHPADQCASTAISFGQCLTGLDGLLAGHPISDRELREVLGHTPMEVLGGICLGMAVGLLYWMYVG